MTRQFLRCSEIRKVDVEPVENISKSIFRYRPGIDPFRFTVWKGSEDERELFLHGKGGGRLIQKFVDGKVGEAKIIGRVSSYEEVTGFEVDSLAVYPLFNERLRLCFEFGKNVDPEKELLFCIEPLPQYKRYIEIMSRSNAH